MKNITLIFCLSMFPVLAISQSDYSYGEWDTTLTSMSEARYIFSAVTYHDSIYVIGGVDNDGGTFEYRSSVDVYDPASDTWTIGVTEVPYAMCCPNSCLINNKIYVLGGLRFPASGVDVIDSVFIYDIQSNTWETGKTIPASVPVLSVDTIGGKIYLAGGTTGGYSIVNNLYVYDPEADEWMEKAPMNVTRRAANARSWNGKLYVFGGYTGSSWAVTKSIEVYDPETDEWTLLSNANIPRTTMGMSLSANQLMVFGGVHGHSSTAYYYTEDISRYDLLNDTWLDFHSEGDKLPANRQFPVSAVVGDTFYVFGGFLDNVTWDNTWGYSLKSVQQNMALCDTVFSAESLELDLEPYFSSTEEGALSYSVCPDYDDEIISTSIEGSVLTIDKLSEAAGSIEIGLNVCNATDTISTNRFSLEIPLGIQAQTDNRLSVYPNPASSVAVITHRMTGAGKISLEIYTATGQRVEQFELENAREEACSFEWNVEDYCNGLYFVILKTQSARLVSKILVQHE